MAVAVTCTEEFASNQPLGGAIDPPAAGLADVVRKYCVVKVAVYVAGEFPAVTGWLAAPPSDQLANTYCVPAPPACVAAATVCEEPGVH